MNISSSEGVILLAPVCAGLPLRLPSALRLSFPLLTHHQYKRQLLEFSSTNFSSHAENN